MKKTLTFLFLLWFPALVAQEIDSILRNMEAEKQPEPVLATFKSPKLVLLQTNETQHDRTLTFWISHRFGDIGGESGGSHSLWGLDAATDIHIGFDYGISDDLSLGIGRSKFNETYNLQLKYRLLEQVEKGMLLSLTLFNQNAWVTRKEFFDDEFPDEADRVSNFLQLIVARKFSPTLSVMLNPGYLFGSRISDPLDEQNFFVLGMGARFKFTRRLSLIADYMLVNGLDRPSDLEIDYYNPLGIGLEIETGGHVFSLNFQNSPFILANNFIPNTRKSWKDGEVRFGFSISRDFYLGPQKQKLPPDDEY